MKEKHPKFIESAPNFIERGSFSFVLAELCSYTGNRACSEKIPRPELASNRTQHLYNTVVYLYSFKWSHLSRPEFLKENLSTITYLISAYLGEVKIFSEKAEEAIF
mgnify:CR=1 FL=1